MQQNEVIIKSENFKITVTKDPCPKMYYHDKRGFLTLEISIDEKLSQIAIKTYQNFNDFEIVVEHSNTQKRILDFLPRNNKMKVIAVVKDHKKKSSPKVPNRESIILVGPPGLSITPEIREKIESILETSNSKEE